MKNGMARSPHEAKPVEIFLSRTIIASIDHNTPMLRKKWYSFFSEQSHNYLMDFLHFSVKCSEVFNLRACHNSVAVSAMTLLTGHHEEHPARKNCVMRCWRGYPSGARCRLFAYGPADASASQNPIISCLAVKLV